jgi:nucleoid-associated protein YgaU
MRKDVKVGLASGGVLLAVIVVYVSSVNKPARATKPGATLALAGKSSSSTTGGSAASPGSTSSEQGTTFARTEKVGEPVRTATPTSDSPVAAASGEPDWAKLLDTGAPPALMTRTGGPDPAPASAGQAPPAQPDVFDNTVPATSTTPTGAGSVTVIPTVNNTTPTGTTSTPAPAALATTPAGAPVATIGPTRTTPALTPVPPTAGRSTTYVIKSGDNFSTIARDVYGNSHFYPHIMRANPDIDPAKLRPGMKIVLPDPASVNPVESATPVVNPTTPTVKRTTTSTSSDKPVAADEYRVQSNDNLYRISLKLYGTPKRSDEIYELNKARIGDDPAKLKIGQVLKLPAPPTKKVS